jgi:hypothetical protein
MDSASISEDDYVQTGAYTDTTATKIAVDTALSPSKGPKGKE